MGSLRLSTCHAAATLDGGEVEVSESLERAHETIHEHASENDRWNRGVAVLVSALAAVLALTEIGGKAAQVSYLTHHVTWTNDWAFFQAKNLRAVVRTSAADLMASLPNAEDPQVQARIKETRDIAARLRDDPEGGEGMKQLAAKADVEQEARDAAAERYHIYEYSVGGLQLAIVLASVSVVTRIRSMTIGAGVIGAAAAAVALGVALHLI
jgi:hypothetical protein